VVSLHVSLDHRNDRRALTRGEADVLIDQIHVRVHDRELAVRLAAQNVRGAGSLVVEQLSKVHASTSESVEQT